MADRIAQIEKEFNDVNEVKGFGAALHGLAEALNRVERQLDDSDAALRASGTRPTAEEETTAAHTACDAQAICNGTSRQLFFKGFRAAVEWLHGARPLFDAAPQTPDLAALRANLYEVRDRLWSYSRSPHNDSERWQYAVASELTKQLDELAAALRTSPAQQPQVDVNALIALMLDIRRARDTWQTDPTTVDDCIVAADVWAKEVQNILRPFESAATSPSPPTPDLETLIAKWRAEGARCDSFHATMGTGYHVCADALADLVAALA